jgi:chloride channel 3/4/5
MSKAPRAYRSIEDYRAQDDAADHDERDDTISSTTPTSPVATFRHPRHARGSETDLTRSNLTERSSLLGNPQGHASQSYLSVPASMPGTPRPGMKRNGEDSQLSQSPTYPNPSDPHTGAQPERRGDRPLAQVTCDDGLNMVLS